MQCYNETMKKVEEMVDAMEKAGKSERYIRGYLISAWSITLAYDIDEYGYNRSMAFIDSTNNRMSENMEGKQNVETV